MPPEIRKGLSYLVDPRPTDEFGQPFVGTVFKIDGEKYLVADRRRLTPTVRPADVGFWVLASQLTETTQHHPFPEMLIPSQYVYVFCMSDRVPILIGTDKAALIEKAKETIRPEAPDLQFWRCAGGQLFSLTATRVPVPSFFNPVS